MSADQSEAMLDELAVAPLALVQRLFGNLSCRFALRHRPILHPESHSCAQGGYLFWTQIAQLVPPGTCGAARLNDRNGGRSTSPYAKGPKLKPAV
jgi:hypothetical protein